MAKNNIQNKANLNHGANQLQKARNTEEFSQELTQQYSQQQSNPTQGNKKHKK